MNNFIICPFCGFQYLPGEIYDPKHFLGQPKDIIRNNIGEILGHEGISMDLNESYTCENCEQQFNVTGKISFNVTTNNESLSEKGPEIIKPSLFN